MSFHVLFAIRISRSRGGSKSDYVPHLLIKAFMHGGNNACLIDPRESHMDLLAESFYTTDKQMDD